ncbi:MAG: LuxR C-terminal-related transcriptional regulator [Planctomycetota bacterium]
MTSFSSVHSNLPTEQVYLVGLSPSIIQAWCQTDHATEFATKVFPSVTDFIHDPNFYAYDRPGCLITELTHRDTQALKLLKELRACKSSIAAIVLAREASIAQVVNAMQSGALKVVELPVETPELIDDFRCALKVSKKTFVRRRRTRDAFRRLQLLTDRERLVLDCVFEGLTNREIAGRLDIGLRTVELRRQSIKLKWGVNSTAELVKVAMMANSEEMENQNQTAISGHDELDGLSQPTTDAAQ